ncbi:MAG TPA: TIGR03960 family B12-binding radical SAM protein [Desulfatiglandales bacterium]|nr:TIGR03960 family B12-binding radical SAM protein [Desulfatiglandales bacterium]
MDIWQYEWFSKILRPSRYLGGEINAVTKDPGDVAVTIALAFPDVYEIGMSHSGLKILYHILNGENWLSAERVFAPWVDLEAELRARDLNLTSLESGRPLGDFDIIGFSLQHELCYTNVLSMLDLGHIPLLSGERKPGDPLIIAGGPACFNPEPVAGIFDAIVVGDGEETALWICEKVREWKLQGSTSKLELLRELSTLKGIYVPSFFEVRYGQGGVVYSIEALEAGYTAVEKALVPDINSYPFPSRQIVPFTELVHDRFTVEIARGCSRGCRFCQAGMIYRPVRERRPSEIVHAAEKGLLETGFEDLSLLSLSSGDYSCVAPLLQELMARVADRHVAVSFSSLRVDSAISQLMEEIKKVRKTSFTVAPEAGSQRLRDSINKGLTDDQILQTAAQIYDGGWNLMKLYFMIGLPYEDEDDLAAIVELSKEIARLAPRGSKKNVLNVSVATFVPKAHTPFQWMPQVSLEESKRRINSIRERLDSRRVRVKWNRPDASWLEGIFSRGDRRLTGVLLDAWQQGARFDSWTEHFNIDIWRKALQRHGLDPDLYLRRQRDQDEILPWEHIKAGVTKDFLVSEWEKAGKAERTPDCREGCLDCGVCKDPGISPIIFDGPHQFAERANRLPKEDHHRIKRYRLRFTKLDKAQYLSHLELSRLFIRAFGRVGLNLVYSGGYHPMPKVSFATALPVGLESMGEIMDIYVKDTWDSSFPIDRLNKELPSGIRVLFAEEVSIDNPSPQIKESHFLLTIHGSFKSDDLDRFLKLRSYMAIKRQRNGERTVDIRSQVKVLHLVSPHELELVTRHGIGPEMRPAEIIKEICALSEGDLVGMRIVKTRGVLV